MTRAVSRPCLVLDACCVINIGAAGDLATLLRSIPYDSWMPSIATKEVLHIRQPDEKNPALQVERELSLAPVVDAGHLHICELDGDEVALFVQFAIELDDGEAACLAVAKHRGWVIATDDRKARRIAAASGVALLGTPELVKAWADHTKADAAAIKAVVARVRTFARFTPPPNSPLAAWWSKQS